MSPDRITGKRILLAEDQQGVRDTIKYLLRMDEHVITEACDGEEALDLYRRQTFDLVITDFSMPRMCGDELAVNIRKISPSQRILMITAYSARLEQAENPVDMILSKPFSFQDLRNAMVDLLSKQVV